MGTSLIEDLRLADRMTNLGKEHKKEAKKSMLEEGRKKFHILDRAVRTDNFLQWYAGG
ncbi:MAG: hypothetical protein HY518_05365, partial [Candidatus Aenigmarchaeota archaeon]|nr:hypothetical protein [Candidatus Aenigmarchaeota archaeon]